MSRFQKKSLPITTKPKFKPAIITNQVQIVEPIIDVKPLTERVITGPIIATSIESLLETIVEQPKIELSIEQQITIEEPIKEEPKLESSNVTTLIDDIERKELKRKRSRELFKLTVEQILLNERKKKLNDEWHV